MPTLGQLLQPRDGRPETTVMEADVTGPGTAQTIQSSRGPCLNYTGAPRSSGSVLILWIDGGRAAVGWRP